MASLAAVASAISAVMIAVAPPPVLEPPPPIGEVSAEDSGSGSGSSSGSEANPWLIAGTSLAIVGVLGAWGYGAWWNEELTSFHFKDTGFLNRDTYAGGADKLGHTYVCYIATLSVTRLYEALGMSHRGAAWLSSAAVMLVSNGVEVTDGFTDYGFEYGDVIANTLGIAAGLADELSPEFAATFGMRLGYVPSRDFLANEKTFIKFINDYTGMLFYFDVKGKGLMELFGREPGIARYLIGGLVWGTNKYSPVRVDEERRRLLGVHFGLSLPEILRSAYPEDEGVEAYATMFDYYAVPMLSIAVMNDLNSGEWMLNFGVANRMEIGF